MDDFVRNKLNLWGLNELREKFEDEGIDKESLYYLMDKDIDELIPKMGPRIRFKQRLKKMKEEESTEMAMESFSAQTLPSNSDTRKRKVDFQSDSSKFQPTKKRKNEAIFSDLWIFCGVKNIMADVQAKLQNQEDTKVNNFLKTKIMNLETEKRELVGVFGKTGAGKTSLINAVIEEERLLPSGSLSACTSVMIKVEANRLNHKYEAEIEFITKEEWEDELSSRDQFLKDNEDQEKDEEYNDEYHDLVEKLSAIYGEDWKWKTTEQLMEHKYFREIPEFRQSIRKTLTCESAEALSAKMIKYTRSDTKQEGGEVVKRWYWPLVKCVTVRVPNKNFLQHVTLVDLPGNGDRNKSRDEMWKGIVGNCSTVWIVSEINRAAAERESWEILKSASSLLGNGGECRHIHFICTKSDITEDSHDEAAVLDSILKRNMSAKESVRKEFNKLARVKKHFNEDCFQVFTVSSKEFVKRKYLSPEYTEIPKLQEFLQNLNDCHSETSNYLSGANGILSLIQGAKSGNMSGENKDVCKELQRNLSQQSDLIRYAMMENYKTFEKCLQEGVEKSKHSFEKILRTFLYPPRKSDRGFYKQLRKLVENKGVLKPKRRPEKNLNTKLISLLTDSIDEEFKKTFPNDGKCGPIYGVIKEFSLDVEGLKQKYSDVELQLVFLKNEEEQLKTKLTKLIRNRKKNIYNSLARTAEEILQECYDKAAGFSGTGLLQNMRETIERHVHKSKDILFEKAKDEMLDLHSSLTTEILATLERTMKESIELSFKIDKESIPDVSEELTRVQQLHEEFLKSS
ncbi:nuclear GTPase SLIP-GC-like [Cyprinodon tularosa]|uniref:nuclear GTPase SLIP-GC-like n=1 Tax=Cyprinodon tularosa TaxID=77115 RepID=UPI0018E28A9D|nr:nuclear GTPase SLIP-GC-like [Cyprinodon tularosa]